MSSKITPMWDPRRMIDLELTAIQRRQNIVYPKSDPTPEEIADCIREARAILGLPEDDAEEIAEQATARRDSGPPDGD